MPVVSEIRLFSFSYAPKGWAKCDGSLLKVADFFELFLQLKYRFGGEGLEFRLPDLRGRVLIDSGANRPAFFRAGVEQHVLTTKEMPKHNHAAVASSLPADVNIPGEHFWASDVGYVSAKDSEMHLEALAVSGEDAGHNNMSPYLPLNYCIALKGDRAEQDYKDVFEYTGAIRPFANFVGDGTWLKCDGRELQIQQYSGLFSVIRYTYGGQENRTFRLPDLRGRALVSCGTPPALTHYELGEQAGEAAVKLTKAQMPAHNHIPTANEGVNNDKPNLSVWANDKSKRPAPNVFASKKGTGAPMHSEAIGWVGDDETHNNMMPYQVMEFMICANGEPPTAG